MVKEKYQTHKLVPLHEKISKKEVDELFLKHNITFQQLPKILIADPALLELEAKQGDVIRITRESPTAGTTMYYRGVSNE
jgi:DNA-directed RNA polymerase subunit H